MAPPLEPPGNNHISPEDAAYKALAQYAASINEYLQEDITESDTRAKFIDVFLRDVLGWQESNIRRELTYWTEGEKAAIDYVIGHGAAFLVVEAKRQRLDFELPNDRQQLLYKLDGVVRSHPNIWSAIQQARRYCDDQGIPYAMATNGRQFALFKAITLNHSWKTGSVAVFDLDSLQNAFFTNIFKALAAASCTTTALDILLGHCQPSIECFRIADTVQSQIGRMSNKLTDVVEQTFAEVLRDQAEPSEAFLEECYTHDQTTDFHAKSLQALLQDPTPGFVGGANSARPGSRKDPFARALSANLERSGLRPPILLIGGKGVGKTTFLNWFLKVTDFRNSVKGDVIVWVDFKGIEFHHTEVHEKLHKILAHQLENSSALGVDSFDALNEVFRDKIRAEKKRLLAPYAADQTVLEQKVSDLIGRWQADYHAYVGDLIKYATQHCSKRVLIILDNADQKTLEFQCAVHDLAQQLCADFPVTMVLSLRENTYFRLSKAARGNAFSQQQMFHIRAPALKSVLSNRLTYLSSRLSRMNISMTTAAGYSLEISNVGDFVGLLTRSLLESKDAPQIIDLVCAISNGSVRESLNLIYDFLVSGHTKMETYFWEYAKNKASFIPFHEFLGSVLVNEMAFFSEANSRSFLNVFRRSQALGDSHFTRLRLLALVEALSPGNSLRPEDFVSITDIRQAFRQAGVPVEVLNGHLQALIRYGLIQANTLTTLSDDASTTDEFNAIESLHITAAGKYYKDRLAWDFQYLRQVIPDTPIFSRAVFHEIDALFGPYKSYNFLVPLEKALLAVENFTAYLQSEESAEHSQSPLGSGGPLRSVAFFPAASGIIQSKIAHIRRALVQARQGSSGQPAG